MPKRGHFHNTPDGAILSGIFVMKQLQKNGAAEINRLHAELMLTLRTSVKDAIEIGELLVAEKEKVGHGNWVKWLKQNIQFSARAAVNYMGLYENKSDPKLADCANLSQAVKLISDAPKKDGTPRKKREDKPKPEPNQGQQPAKKIKPKLLKDIEYWFENDRMPAMTPRAVTDCLIEIINRYEF